jgi:hypothetical protein
MIGIKTLLTAERGYNWIYNDNNNIISAKVVSDFS